MSWVYQVVVQIMSSQKLGQGDARSGREVYILAILLPGLSQAHNRNSLRGPGKQ